MYRILNWRRFWTEFGKVRWRWSLIGYLEDTTFSIIVFEYRLKRGSWCPWLLKMICMFEYFIPIQYRIWHLKALRQNKIVRPFWNISGVSKIIFQSPLTLSSFGACSTYLGDPLILFCLLSPAYIQGGGAKLDLGLLVSLENSHMPWKTNK